MNIACWWTANGAMTRSARTAGQMKWAVKTASASLTVFSLCAGEKSARSRLGYAPWSGARASPSAQRSWADELPMDGDGPACDWDAFLLLHGRVAGKLRRG